MSITMLHADCMEFMRGQPDGAFDLAIVDPPYGIGAEDGTGDYSKAINKVGKKWDALTPPQKYFEELMRVSENQIIWGGNYFLLPANRGWVCWYKSDEVKGRDFSEFELAWTSFDVPARHIEEKPFQRDGSRIHPTQKPVALYKWLLTRYARPGQRILDTHGGSGSDCIAVHDVNADLVSRGLEPMTLTWMELDADYYAAAVKRYTEHARQGTLFEPEPVKKPEQKELI